MLHKLDYTLINKQNKAQFEEYISEIVTWDILPNSSLGILADGKPLGAVILNRTDKSMAIRSIRLSDSLNAGAVLKEIVKVLCKLGDKSGCNILECRYTNDDPGITEQMLRDAGFKNFDEDTVVYKADAYTLGSLLRDGPDAIAMREAGVRLMTMDRVRCFDAIPEDVRSLFKKLYPTDELSFMITDADGKPEDYIVISELPDGSLYLADVECQIGHEAEVMGLLYMCFGKVFMRIEPDGEFYIAAVSDGYKRFAERFFEPVLPLVSVQKILTASLKL
ncbi:MAG: hypothetical protein K6F54_10225 [Lachnospiraceae bacterium]|nr:hypothetical protein [Lachnospiraceae bacterium]